MLTSGGVIGGTLAGLIQRIALQRARLASRGLVVISAISWGIAWFASLSATWTIIIFFIAKSMTGGPYIELDDIIPLIWALSGGLGGGLVGIAYLLSIKHTRKNPFRTVLSAVLGWGSAWVVPIMISEYLTGWDFSGSISTIRYIVYILALGTLSGFEIGGFTGIAVVLLGMQRTSSLLSYIPGRLMKKSGDEQ
jgi:hypothetical protein